jgi:hypothetical protein
MESDQRRRPLDHELLERAQHAEPRPLAVDVVHDELREQRVVEARNLVSGPDSGVDANSDSARLLVCGDQSRRRQEAARSVLRVDPALDRMSPDQ